MADIFLNSHMLFDNCLTNRVKWVEISQNLIKYPMNEETTTVRNFLRNYKKFVEKKRIIIVENHGVPEVVFIPFEEWKKQNKNKNKTNLRKIPIRELIKNLTFKGDPNLSKDIDKILYDENFR